MTITYLLPSNTVCLFKQGAKIDFQTPFLEKKIDKEIEIHVAHKLNIDPKNIFRYLKKFVGERVEKNNLLAEKKGLFSAKKIFSSEDGVIKEIDHNKGVLMILTEGSEKNKIFSPFIGQVEETGKNEIKIRVNKGEEFLVKNPTGDFGGEVISLDQDVSSLPSTEFTTKVILIEKINSYLQVKTEAMGTKGFVTLEKLPEKTEIHSATIKNLEDFKKIKKINYPYCTVIAQSAKIYFYS